MNVVFNYIPKTIQQQKQSMHFYQVFGISIQSEMPLEGLINIDPILQPTVRISYGKIQAPPKDNPAFKYEGTAVYNKDFYYIKTVEEIAEFLVKKPSNGLTEVIFDLKNKEKEQTALAWFYGIVMGAILQLNDLFALHASGVLFQNQLYLFCGNSGMGKSTIAAQLKSRGYPLFTDDKCVLRWQDSTEQYLANPGLQIMRLWENSTNQIEHADFLTDPVPVIFKSKKKQFRIKSSELILEDKPLKSIYILSNVPKQGKLRCIPLKGIQKVRFLQKQIYRFNLVKGFEKEMVLWQFLQQLVQKIPIYLIRRPQNTPIPVFGDFVESLIKN